MIAYILAPIFAFISSIIFVLPSEVALLVLANIGTDPINVFGKTLDFTKYGTDFPWLLPVVAAGGSILGSYVYYLMGTGALNMSTKVKDKMESFDFDKMGKAREAVILVSNIISVPPVSAVSVASGMIKFNMPKFMLVSFIGKTIRYYIVIIAGHFAIGSLLNFLT